MKKRVISAAMLLAFAGAPAFAGTVENSIGNTVVVTTADGSKTEIKLRADGTLTRVTPDGAAQEGTWSNAPGPFCYTVNGDKACPQIPPDEKIGGSWTDRDANGPLTIKLVAGQ